VKRYYYVYILRCFDGSFYVGITNNIDRRFYEHSAGINETCYTYRRRPLILAYVQEFGEVLDALDAETRLKHWSHRKKLAFLEGRMGDLKRYARGKNRHERQRPP
jgi:putative endonuclease